MASTNLERIIDGDGHILEDMEGIAKFLPAAYRSTGRATGIFPPLDHMHSQPSITPPGSFHNPDAANGWVRFLDDVGIDAAVLYPTTGLAHGKTIDVDWAIAGTRAYNDWLYETYLKKSPRLKGMGLIPLQEPEAAVEELRRVVNELGMCGAMLPSMGLKAHLGAKDYWPVYRMADRLGCSLAVHGGCHSGLGFDNLNVFAAVHAMGHPLGILIGFGSMLINGVFDKFPNAKYGFLEGGVGWFIMAVERFEGSYNNFKPYDPRGELLRLEKGESVGDYIRRHVAEGRIYVGVEGDEPALAYAVKAIGSEAFIFSSDFPHEVNNEGIRHEIHELLESEEMTAKEKEAVLFRNAERFYNLTPASR